MESITGKVLNLSHLYRRFQRLTDPRKPKGKRYALSTILLGMVLAKLCGEDKPSGMAQWVQLRGEWLAGVLGLKRKEMPSHHTYRRVLAQGVEVEELEALARAHHRRHGKAGYQVVLSIDGKVIRGTIDLEVSDGLCLLAAYLPGEGITLAQLAVENLQNEISAAPWLLDLVDLRNKVVIGDAIHTQREVSIQIGRAGGHYLWTVKGNHPQLHQDLQDWFDGEVQLIPGMGCPPKDFRSFTSTTKGHGRLETRTLTTSSQLNDFLKWPFLQQVFKLERTATICKTGKMRHEVVYGLTNLSAEEASPEQLLQKLRSYWGVESGLHYRRDVSLHEDQTRFKSHAAAQVMAILNNLVVGLIAQTEFLFVPSARRYYAAHPEAALDLLL